MPYRLWRASQEGTLDLGHAGVTAALHWLVPLLMCAFLLFGFFRGVKVYEALTDGAQSITPEVFAKTVKECAAVAAALGRA